MEDEEVCMSGNKADRLSWESFSGRGGKMVNLQQSKEKKKSAGCSLANKANNFAGSCKSPGLTAAQRQPHCDC